MKNRRFLILIFAAFLGICAGIMRGIEMAYHFDWSTAMFEPFSAAFVLPAYSIAAALVILIFSLACHGKISDYCAAYRIRGKFGLFIDVLSALVLGLAGLWRTLSAVKTGRASYIVFGILTVLTAAVMIALSRSRHSGRLGVYTRSFSSLLIYWACFLLVLTYMEHPVEPVLRVFCYDILAASFLTLASFYEIAPIFSVKRRSAAVFFSLGSIFLILLTVVGRGTAFLLSGDLNNIFDAPWRMLAFVCMGLRIFQTTAGLLSDPQ